jgi:hypothetical protein
MIAHLPTAALTTEASTLLLMLGIGGFGFATFFVSMKIGQIVGSVWWKEKLQEALTSTREPPPSRQMSLVHRRLDSRRRGQHPRPLQGALRAAAAVSLSGLQRQENGFREHVSP